jgi:hypothetical protein
MTTPPLQLADIRAGHLTAIREANVTIQQARAGIAAAARLRRALIAELRDAGMSTYEIAAEVGLSQPRITQIMTGKVDVNPAAPRGATS